jgi:uncharacterized membrane protein
VLGIGAAQGGRRLEIELMARTTPDVDVEEDYGAVPAIPPWWPWVAFGLSLVGFGISLYLTIEHFQGKLLPCPANAVFNCQKVTTSKYSHVFGVPVALAGLLFYTGMVGINSPPLWWTRARWVPRARLAMAASGICFVLYLLAAELFSIKAICLWCTGVHVTTFFLFILVVASFPLMSGRARQFQEWAEDGGAA